MSVLKIDYFETPGSPLELENLFIFVSCIKVSKMIYKITFQERAKLGLEQLSKQLPTTLKKARLQAQKLKTQSLSKNKKQRT